MTRNTTILLSWLVSFLTAFLVTWRLSLRCIDWGRRFNIMSEVEERSSHTVPTPRIGGVAIFVGFFCAILTGMLFIGFLSAARGDADTLRSAARSFRGDFGAILTSAVLFFLLGLIDDIRNLPAPAKFAGQVIALIPVALFAPDFHIQDWVATWTTIPSPEGQIPLLSPWRIGALLWVLFFVNAYNFMDGMDGLATVFSIHVCLWLMLVVALWSLIEISARPETIVLASTLGASGGFLIVNAPPARMFMGDGGSHFLGFVLAAAALQAASGRMFDPYGDNVFDLPASVNCIPVLLLFFPFIFDVVITLLRRLSRGENPLTPHRSHLYQRLLATGMSHREVLEGVHLTILFFIGVCFLLNWFRFVGSYFFSSPAPTLSEQITGSLWFWAAAHAIMSVHLVSVHLAESKIKRT